MAVDQVGYGLKCRHRAEGLVEIRYVITLDDYAEANRVWQQNTTFRRKLNYYLYVRFGFWIGIPLFGAGLSAFLLNLFSARYRLGPAVAGATAAAAWVGFIFLVCPFAYKRKLARCFREQKLPSERILTAADSGVAVVRTDGSAESRYGWSAFDKSAESDRAFVLFPNLRQFISVPKRVMTPEQQQEFRELLAAHVPGPGNPASVGS